MEDNDSFPVPSEVIDVRSCPRSELIFDTRTRNLSRYTLNDRRIFYGRFAYALPRHNSIVLCDLFLGDEKKFVPKTPNNVAYMMSYVPLSLDLGFSVYATTTNPNYKHNPYRDERESVRASIVSIDFYKGTYKLLGASYDFSAWDCHRLQYFAPNSITAWCTAVGLPMSTLFLFKLDDSLSSIISQRVIEIPKGYGGFNLIDTKIICFKNGPTTDNIYAIINIEGVCYLEDDGSFTKINNTGVCLKSHFFPGNNYKIWYPGVGGWRDSRFFMGYPVIDDSDKASCTQNRLYIIFLWVFEMSTKKWSEIRLDFSFNKYFYQSNLDSDGILTFTLHGKEICNESPEYNVTVVRIALGKPEKLLNICWFQACKYGLDSKFYNLIDFVKAIP